ncbi:MAG TPA: DUF4238 domain-containing protein [Candidatus Eremiobacteraceae bacterium]|nr:DUF4238 domain-containing protein [Candidatus Eremiobacteraceae bacterium]
MVPRKRLNHFNPQSYLRAFADPDGYLLTIKREPYEVDRLNVAKVAAERDFYTLRRADGTLTDQLEDELALFDAKIPRIVGRVASVCEPSPADVDDLKRLYAILLARGPVGRDYILDEVRSTRDRITSDFKADFPDEDESTCEGTVDRIIRDFYEHSDELSADAATVSRANVPRLADEIASAMPKFVCVMRSASWDFLTSDTPCSAFDPKAPPVGDGVYGVDYDSPTVELTLPLSRRHLALFANRPVLARAKCNDGAVRIANGRTVFFSKRMIFAYPSADAEANAIALAQQITYRTAYCEPMLPAFDEMTSSTIS